MVLFAAQVVNGVISMAIGSSDHPWLTDSDHILLSQDNGNRTG